MKSDVEINKILKEERKALKKSLGKEENKKYKAQFDKMEEEDRRERFKIALGLSRALLILGLGGALMSTIYFHDWYYFGEPLVNKMVTVKTPPLYVGGGKHGTKRYTFDVNEYGCEFWLSSGALSLIEHNSESMKLVKSMKEGDTINIGFRAADMRDANDESAKLRVMDLSQNGTVIVSGAKVADDDRSSFYWRMGVSVLLVIAGAVAEIRSRIS